MSRKVRRALPRPVAATAMTAAERDEAGRLRDAMRATPEGPAREAAIKLYLDYLESLLRGK